MIFGWADPINLELLSMRFGLKLRLIFLCYNTNIETIFYPVIALCQGECPLVFQQRSDSIIIWSHMLLLFTAHININVFTRETARVGLIVNTSKTK